MPVAVAHLTIAATWLGSMVYSLLVVQPRIARFFLGSTTDRVSEHCPCTVMIVK